MKKRPHIIIFNPDEMRYDTMGHMGNKAAYTPFLDYFAKKEGVSFSNAYCQNPVCVPSRCSFFTGLYPHVSGHRTMSHLLHPGEDSLFSELKAAGYYVWMNSRNDLYAGQIEGWAESNADTIFYGGEKVSSPGPVDEERLKEEKYKYSHFEGKLGLNEQGVNYNADDESVDAAIDFIKGYDGEKPICLFLGLMFPHTPYGVEEPYYSLPDRAGLSKRIMPSELSGKSRMMDLIRDYQKLDGFTEEDWDELRTVYLGMCSKIDAQFRHLCDALKDAGIYDDCAIFFLSDHGDFCGDYGLTEKAQSTFEDCLTRVPLLIKPPKWEGCDAGVADNMTELVDFYATAMDYAGVQPSHTCFGKSLRPVIEDRHVQLREFACCEGGRLPEEEHCDEYHAAKGGRSRDFVYWPKMMAQTDDEAHAKAVMIRTKQYKFVRRISGENELYDMEHDPRETTNLINDKKYSEVIAELSMKLLQWYQETSDIVPYTLDERFTEEMLFSKVKKICPPEFEAEVRQKIREGMKLGELGNYVKSLKA